MTSDFFPYDQLTWPDVAELPRDTPLVIPLGSGYDREMVSQALGRPSRIGWLPPIPFGWRNSGLAVPEPLLAALLANLLASLRDDGFSRVYALAPQGIDLSLGEQRLALSHASHFAPGAPLPPDGERAKVVLLPIGHTEQHGYHLPLSTDNLIIEAIGRGTAAAAPDLATCLPAFPYGVSTHRPSFAGTLNAGRGPLTR